MVGGGEGCLRKREWYVQRPSGRQDGFIEILQQHPKRKHLILLMRKLGF